MACTWSVGTSVIPALSSEIFESKDLNSSSAFVCVPVASATFRVTVCQLSEL